MQEQSNARDEEWRAVEGYEGYYEVSSLGRVRSLDRVIFDTVRKRHRSMKGLTLKQVTNVKGYRLVNLSKSNQQKGALVSRLVAKAFHPESYFDGAEVCHNNGVPDDNTVANLRWDTAKGNSRDRVPHGTHIRGERNPGAKLDAEAVTAIRRLFATSSLSKPELVKKFNVVTATIDDILAARSWAHLPFPLESRKSTQET